MAELDAPQVPGTRSPVPREASCSQRRAPRRDRPRSGTSGRCGEHEAIDAGALISGVAARLRSPSPRSRSGCSGAAGPQGSHVPCRDEPTAPGHRRPKLGCDGTAALVAEHARERGKASHLRDTPVPLRASREARCKLVEAPKGQHQEHIGPGPRELRHEVDWPRRSDATTCTSLPGPARFGRRPGWTRSSGMPRSRASSIGPMTTTSAPVKLRR